jgi:hypothetical protein
LASVIEIDEEGNVKVDNNEVSLSDSQKDNAKYLAWISYQLQNNSNCLYFEELGQGRGGICYGGLEFRNELEKIAGALGLNMNVKYDGAAVQLPEISYDNYLNCDTAYVAKLFYFQLYNNGAGQEQVVAFAKEGKKVSINKYIVETGLYGAISNRKYLSENEKKANPASVASNITVKYQIEVDGPTTAKYEIKDTWDTGLTFISCSNNGVSGNNTVTWKNIPGGTVLTLTLQTITGISSDRIYENKAEIVGKNVHSSDYVKTLEEKCTIDKYITAISGSNPAPSIGNRAGLSDSVKMSSAPKVSGTSVSVTYQIVIKNTGVAPVSGTYSDIWDSTMSYVSGSTSETFTLSPGASKIYTVVLRLSTTTLVQYYTNTAQFVYGATKITSSDYVQGYTEEKISGSIKKYISSANGKSYGINRKNMSTTSKYADPVEVVKRSYCNL